MSRWRHHSILLKIYSRSNLGRILGLLSEISWRVIAGSRLLSREAIPNHSDLTASSTLIGATRNQVVESFGVLRSAFRTSRALRARTGQFSLEAWGLFLTAFACELLVLALLRLAPLRVLHWAIPALVLGFPLALYRGAWLGAQVRRFLFSESPVMRAQGEPLHRSIPLILGILTASGLLLRQTTWGPSLGISLCLLLGLLLVRHWGRTDIRFALVLLAALAARLLFIAADMSFDLLEKSDAMSYHFNAGIVADYWRDGGAWYIARKDTHDAYVLPVASLYFFFGADPLLARVANSVLGMLAVFNVYRIGTALMRQREALVGAFLLALLPSVAQLHGQHLREALVLFLITSAFRLLLSERLRAVPALMLAALAAGTVSFLRMPTVAVLILPLLGLAAYRLLKARAGAFSPGAYSAGLRWAATALLLLVGGMLLSRLGVATFLDPRILEYFRGHWAVGGSAYLTDVSFASWLDVIIFVPLGTAYFLFTPFPWQVHTPAALLAAGENLLIVYPAAILAAAAAWRMRRRPEVLILVAFLVTGAAAFGIIEGNVGTALRHRAQFTWVILMLAGPAIASWIRPGRRENEADPVAT